MALQPAAARVPPSEPPVGSPEDEPPFARLKWLTSRHLSFFVIAWLVLFSLGSVLIANPFEAESSASATPDFWRVMYLHGLLIGMVGLLALLVCGVFCLRSRHTRAWIVGGVLFATIVTAIGGIWDRQIPGAEIPMWTQIFGFFALDEILIALLAGMVIEWRRRAPLTRGLPFAVAFVGTASMFVAAVMGHIAGWILEFGASPPIIGDWANAVGLSVSDLAGGLIGSHSHDMAVAVMVVILAVAARQFAFDRLEGVARLLGQAGLAVTAVGAVAMTVMYVAMGVLAWSPPTLFASPDGVNGIAGDDVLTGVFVLGGGVLTIAAFGLGMLARRAEIPLRPTRLAAAWTWLLSFATVVVAGYAIELDESYFGAGDPSAAGASKDAVFTWLHQDFGLFLLPALVVILLVVERLIAPRYQGAIALAVAIGASVVFIGGLDFVFVDPALTGSGYDLSTIGLLVVGVALVATIWWGALRSLVATSTARPGGAAARGI